ncbi:MAG: hypothetical protein WC679_00655 [Bacteroidales bacterium]|jgi:hypothetical protein
MKIHLPNYIKLQVSIDKKVDALELRILNEKSYINSKIFELNGKFKIFYHLIDGVNIDEDYFLSNGTGPFDSLYEAENWLYKGGR